MKPLTFPEIEVDKAERVPSWPKQTNRQKSQLHVKEMSVIPVLCCIKYALLKTAKEIKHLTFVPMFFFIANALSY